MNEKKSKRLRSLVKHLMTQGAVAPNGWLAYTPEVRTHSIERPVIVTANPKHYNTQRPYTVRTLTTAPQGTVFGGTVRLDAACGKAIYKQMKKRALQHRPTV